MKLPKSPRAVITGAGSGLGRAIALRLAARQARLLIADVRLDRAEETAELVRAQGGTAEPRVCDVGELAAVEGLAAEAASLWGGTDVLVNNAGVAVAGAVGDVPMADWEWIMRVNLWGVIYGCHAFVPAMKQRGHGFILNVASNAGIASLPEMAPYNVTKAGVISLSETLYAELAPFGVQVSVLCPTFFKTNLMDSFRSPTQRQRKMAEAFFRRSSCTAERVADAGIEALESGRLMVIPQRDGSLVWRVKRLAPALYHRGLGKQQARARQGGKARVELDD